mmetsp:Transcript_18274/g.41770  ORF Transcript_18274/g.41770 Transcript_18274/m.41770 type:complete len:576 (+) Transcript_18274:556-2283(+)
MRGGARGRVARLWADLRRVGQGRPAPRPGAEDQQVHGGAPGGGEPGGREPGGPGRGRGGKAAGRGGRGGEGPGDLPARALDPGVERVGRGGAQVRPVRDVAPPAERAQDRGVHRGLRPPRHRAVRRRVRQDRPAPAAARGRGRREPATAGGGDPVCVQRGGRPVQHAGHPRQVRVGGPAVGHLEGPPPGAHPHRDEPRAAQRRPREVGEQGRRGQQAALRPAALLAHPPQPGARSQRQRPGCGAEQFAGARGLRQLPVRPAALGRARLRLRLAGAREPPQLDARALARQERVAPHAPPPRLALRLHGALPAPLPAPARDPHPVQGDPARPPRPAARLSRVPLRLPLQLLRRDPAQLHPAPEPLPVGLPPGDAPAGPLHAQPQGGSPARDLAAPADPLQLRGGHHAHPGRGGRLPQDPAAQELPRVAPGPPRPPARKRGTARRGRLQRARHQLAGGVHGHAGDRPPPEQVAEPLARDGGVPGSHEPVRRRGPLPPPQRHRQPAPVPEQPHALLQLRAALPLRRVAVGPGQGANHARLARAAHRPPPSPLGPPHHLHRAHQEPALQLLGPQVHPLRG